jgi:hypothetical protein
MNGGKNLPPKGKFMFIIHTLFHAYSFLILFSLFDDENNNKNNNNS